MERRSVRAWAVGAVAGMCALGMAGTATGGGKAPASAPEPIPASEMRLVISDVEILDGAGAVVARHHCEWTEPQDDDRPCLAFSGDPQDAIAAIRAAGGDGANIHVVSPEIGLDGRSTIRRRAGGRWLFRGESSTPGRKPRGHLCSADGTSCTHWDAARSGGARAAVRAAAARLRNRR